MVLRPRPSRSPFSLALCIALSAACGGGGHNAVAAEYETVPGPDVPQPPAVRRQSAEGDCAITASSGEVTSVPLLSEAGGTTVSSGRESGFRLEMACGDTVADVNVSLFFAVATGVLRVERRAEQWFVDGRSAEVVASRSDSRDAGVAVDADAGADADADADAAVPADASAPPSGSEVVNGVGLPGTDGARLVVVALIANGVRYDIRATVPWRASVAPATCQELKPGTGTEGSRGGCGSSSSSSSSSRRSSGGDWD